MLALPSSSSVVISHCHGNANVRQATVAFAEAGMLRTFWTGLAWNPDSSLARALPGGWRRQLDRRALPASVRPYVRLHPWREAARLAAQATGSRARHWPQLSPNACAQDLDERVARYVAEARGPLDLVYAYDHGALASFQAARRRGAGCLYDLPIGYWRVLDRTLRAERAAWPEWQSLDPDLDFSSSEFLRKDAEIGLADHVVVPSAFVARTLQGYQGRLPPVSVIPFGAPPVPTRDMPRRAAGERLRILYAGALSLRKGTPYLLKALAHFGERVDCTVVGRMSAPCAPAQAALAHMRWIESLPHGELLTLMAQSDVFVFPTLFEGFALVSLEAMSQGCALISTPAFGGEEMILDGVNGFIVPERSVDALVATIERLDRDRDLLARVRAASVTTIADCTWERYRAALRQVVSGASLVAHAA